MEIWSNCFKFSYLTQWSDLLFLLDQIFLEVILWHLWHLWHLSPLWKVALFPKKLVSKCEKIRENCFSIRETYMTEISGNFGWPEHFSDSGQILLRPPPQQCFQIYETLLVLNLTVVQQGATQCYLASILVWRKYLILSITFLDINNTIYQQRLPFSREWVINMFSSLPRNKIVACMAMVENVNKRKRRNAD